MTCKNLPVGTQIVTTADQRSPVGFIKKGSVGVIRQQLEADLFLVKLPDDREVQFAREHLMSQRDSFRVEHMTVDLLPEEIRPWVEFEFVAGSTAYGLNTPDSDEDIVGGYIIPTDRILGLKNFQETVVRHEPDATYHEIKKLIHLACKGNPNVMEFGEIYKIPALVKTAPKNELILELFSRWSELFMSRYVFRAYQGYAMSQFKKLETDLRNQGEIRWKHACHLLRLLWSGAYCLRTGQVVVRPRDFSEDVHNKLMEVRHGVWTLKQLVDYRHQLETEFQEAFDNCKLPEQANFEEAHKLLVEIRKRTFVK